jgi:shikimate dehydrogenase
MQGAAFAEAGLDWQYELWETTLEELPARARMIRDEAQIGGANVTIPHKQNIMPFLDEVSSHAQAIGAVNTITKSATTGAIRLVGDNTDWLGFLADLRWHGVDPSHLQRALVLGAGGSARGIVYALAQCGLRVSVVNRDEARAQRLVNSMQALFSAVGMRALPHTVAALREASADAQLIVNCTSAGMSPNAHTSPWLDGVPFPAGAVMYDLVYKPAETVLMHQASEVGLRVIGGIGMLAEQGAASFERWTGIPAQQVSGVMRVALQTK